MKLKITGLIVITLMAAALLCGCGAEAQLRKGDQKYALGEYTDAAVFYKRAYSATPSSDKELRAERAFILAECYRKVGYIPRALAAYQNAVRYHYPDSVMYRYLGDMQLMNGNLKEARKNYEIALEWNPADILAANGLKSCDLSKEWKENPTRYSVKKESILNSRFSDYSPAFGNEEYNRLYFTSTRNDSEGDELNGITGMKSSDIYMSELDDKGKWKKPVRVEGGLNSPFEDGATALSADFQTMYITRCETDPQVPKPARIYKSSRTDAAWGEVSPYESGMDSIYSYAHPAVSPDGKWMYFVSDMDGGEGGLDIWRVQLGERMIGAENLGPEINTPGDEMFPVFRSDGDLYFSSDGHPGMGGLDIFCAHQESDGHWTVTNMKYPVNSNADDFGITFQGDLNRGFLSSNRTDARGRDNIWSFELPETVHRITGWVYEKDGYELPDATVYLVGDDGTNLRLAVRPDGSFTQRVNPGSRYVLSGTSKGYMNVKEEIQAEDTDEDREYVLQFPLSSITKPVLIDNIFFDFDRATLRPESAESLDGLVQLLIDNPNVTIEIGAHCDYKGNDAYNERLSQQRAESVVSYLVAHGIANARLTAKGYGESQPITVGRKLAEKHAFLKEGDVLNENFVRSLGEEEQEISNQLNRRTEFRVLRTTYGLYGR